MRHTAFGRTLDSLDVVVVEDSRPMQTIFRSVLSACGGQVRPGTARPGVDSRAARTHSPPRFPKEARHDG